MPEIVSSTIGDKSEQHIGGELSVSPRIYPQRYKNTTHTEY